MKEYTVKYEYWNGEIRTQSSTDAEQFNLLIEEMKESRCHKIIEITETDL